MRERCTRISDQQGIRFSKASARGSDYQDASGVSSPTIGAENKVETRMAPDSHWSASRKGSCEEALAKLEHDGVSVECQRLLGALVAYVAQFERLIELGNWAVLEVREVAGVRPETDKGTVSDIIQGIQLRKKARDGSLGQAIDLTCQVATDLLAYRNAIAHGWLMPSGGGRPYFASNVAFHSERRRRSRQDAHITEELLEKAVDSAFCICFSARRIFLACSGPNPFDMDAMADFIAPLERAASQAAELKSMSALQGNDD